MRNVNRYQQTFQRVKKAKCLAFCPFTVVGDPDFETSLKIVSLLVKNGADMLEFGMPFSDPSADGPVIQAADQRALKAGMTVRKMFKFVERVREFTNIPIGLLVYYNLVLQFGIEEFYRAAAKAGLDSVLIADLPIEEADGVVRAAGKYGIAPIFIVSKLTKGRRLKRILRAAEGLAAAEKGKPTEKGATVATEKSGFGFLYVVSLLGVTGVRKGLDQDLKPLIQRLKKQTQLPLVVGFGISEREQVRKLEKIGADGFIVGSGVVKRVRGKKDWDKSRKGLRDYLRSLTTEKYSN